MTFSQLFRAARYPLMAEAEAPAATGDAPAAPAAPSATLLGDPATPAATAPEVPAVPPEGETQEAKAVRETAEKTAKDTAPGAPEAYTDYTLPQDVVIAPEMLTEFNGLAKELGLNQAQAQKLIDLQSKLTVGQTTAQAETMKAAFDKQTTDWAAQAKADPVIGGDKWDASVATAQKAMTQFGTPELREFLNQSGLGNHPQLIKLFHGIGTAISEDKMVLPGNTGGEVVKQAPENVLWPTKAN